MSSLLPFLSSMNFPYQIPLLLGFLCLAAGVYNLYRVSNMAEGEMVAEDLGTTRTRGGLLLEGVLALIAGIVMLLVAVNLAFSPISYPFTA